MKNNIATQATDSHIEYEEEINRLLAEMQPYRVIFDCYADTRLASIIIRLNDEKTRLVIEIPGHADYSGGIEIERNGRIFSNEIYDQVRTVLQNDEEIVDEPELHTTATNQLMAYLINTEGLEDRQGFLDAFTQFIAELPTISLELQGYLQEISAMNIDDIDIDTIDENDPQLKKLGELHRNMIASLTDTYRAQGNRYIVSREGLEETKATEDAEIVGLVSPEFKHRYPEQSTKIERLFEILNRLEIENRLSIIDEIAIILGMLRETSEKLKSYFIARSKPLAAKQKSIIADEENQVLMLSDNYWYSDNDMGQLLKGLAEKAFEGANAAEIERVYNTGLTLDQIGNYLSSLDPLEESKPIFISYNIGGSGSSASDGGVHWVAIVLVRHQGRVKVLYKDSKGDFNNNSAGIEAVFREHYGSAMEFIRHTGIEQKDDSACGPMTIHNLEIMMNLVIQEGGTNHLVNNFRNINFAHQDQVAQIRAQHTGITLQIGNTVETQPEEDGIQTIEEIIHNLRLIKEDGSEIGLSDAVFKLEVTQAIEKIDEFYKSFKEWGMSEIVAWSKEHKGKLAKNNSEKICEAIAIMERANELATHGHRLRDTQKAVIYIFMQTKDKGHISQINTGEGKTTIVSFVEALKVMQGYKGHVITSNGVLAEDGVKNKQTFYGLLGITVAHNNPEEGYTQGPKACYARDIVYGSINNFQFDWLRDSFERLETMQGVDFDNVWAMLDEIDSLLIDQGGNIAKLSGPFPGMESLRYVYINIWAALAEAEAETEKEIKQALQDEAKRLYDLQLRAQEANSDAAALDQLEDQNQKALEVLEDKLSEEFLDRIKAKIIAKKDNLINKEIIAKHLHTYVEQSIDRWIEYAFAAKYQYTEDVEYKLVQQKDKDGKEGEYIIIPVDNQNTGVSMKNTILSNGLHQFLQIKHNLCLTYESLTSSYVSNLGYVTKYGNKLSGVTGTLGSNAERELLGTVFNLGFSIIPPYKEKIFQEFTGRIIEDEQFINDVAIAALAEVMRKDEYGEEKARAVLIVCSSIRDVEEIRQEIHREAVAMGLGFQIKIYTDESEAHVTEKTLGIRDIVIATNIAGRGTDFNTTPQLESNGGLHVIEAFLPCNQRVQDQGMGRTSRQGHHGTGQIIVRLSEIKELGIKYMLDTSSSTRYIQNFEQNLQSMGIQIRNVPGDGNCFFHAVEAQLRLISDNDVPAMNYDELREFAIGYVRNHAAELQNFIEGEELEQYIDRMSKDGAWVDNVLVEALSQQLGINIVIFQNNNIEHPIIVGSAQNQQIIFLGHITELHYVSLENMQNGKVKKVITFAEDDNKYLENIHDADEDSDDDDAIAMTKTSSNGIATIGADYFKTIIKERDRLEGERIKDIKSNKLKELDFKDQLFNRFAALYGRLKDQHKHDEDFKWIYVLHDLKEKWAFWLEQQNYTAEKIIELEGSISDQAQTAFEQFQEEAREIVAGNIRHNPYYSICLAERYLEVGDKANRDKANTELVNALEISDSTELLYSAYMKLFEIAIENGGQVLERYKKAVAKIFFIDVEKSEGYKEEALNQLRQAKQALEIEYDYLTKLITGKQSIQDAADESSVDSVLDYEALTIDRALDLILIPPAQMKDKISSLQYWYSDNDMGRLGRDVVGRLLGEGNIANQFNGGLTLDQIGNYLAGLGHLEERKPIFITYNIGGSGSNATEGGVHWIAIVLVRHQGKIKVLYKDPKGNYRNSAETVEAAFRKHYREHSSAEEIEFIIHNPTSGEQTDAAACGSMTIYNLEIMINLAIQEDGTNRLVENFRDIKDFARQDMVAKIRQTHSQTLSETNQNIFVKHLQARHSALGAYLGNIESLMAQMDGSEALGDSIVIGTKVPRYLSKLDSKVEHEKALKEAITDRAVNELEYVGMSSVIQLKEIHDVPGEVITNSQWQIGGGLAALAITIPFPFLLPINGQIASALIGEGITDIIMALIDQGQTGFDKKDYNKGKIISYGISIVTMGIGAILSSTKILTKAMNACKNLASKLRAIEGPFAKVCKGIANKLDKIAIYLELSIKKIEMVKKGVNAQKQMLVDLHKEASALEKVGKIQEAQKMLSQYQKLQKLQKVSDIVITHSQKLMNILKTTAMGAVKGVAISVAMEKIFTATLNQIMAGLKPEIEKQVKAVITSRIQGEQSRLSKYKDERINEQLKILFQTSLSEDIEHVVKEISLGVLRHCSNWKMQIATLAVESVLAGVDIATCTNKFCNKFLEGLPVLTTETIHQHDYNKIAEQLSEPVSGMIYGKIVSITGKVMITLPKAIYRGYKKHQEHKADKQAVESMKQRIEAVNAAEKGATAQDMACAHNAVSATLGIDNEHLAHSAGLAMSTQGATKDDIKQMYTQNGVNAKESDLGDAVTTLQASNSDRAVVCLTKSGDNAGHAVPVTLENGQLMVTSGGKKTTLTAYQNEHGYNGATTVIIPEGINTESLSAIGHQINRNRVAKVTHPIDFAGKGEGGKFGVLPNGAIHYIIGMSNGDQISAGDTWLMPGHSVDEHGRDTLNQINQKISGMVGNIGNQMVGTAVAVHQKTGEVHIFLGASAGILSANNHNWQKLANDLKTNHPNAQIHTPETSLPFFKELNPGHGIHPSTKVGQYFPTQTYSESSKKRQYLTADGRLITHSYESNIYCALTSIQHQITMAELDPKQYSFFMSEQKTTQQDNISQPSCDDCQSRSNKGVNDHVNNINLVNYWLNYNNNALEDLLSLRLKSLAQIDNQYDIRILSAFEIADLNNNHLHIKLNKVIEQVKQFFYHASNIKQTLLLPILIPQKEFVFHWVGLTITKNNHGVITITYLDSENQPVPLMLQNVLLTELQKLLSGYKIIFKQQELETQRYNNCGPELVENFIYYLTGTRSIQESAVYLHSLIYENSALDIEILSLQIAENNRLIAELSNQMRPIYHMPSEYITREFLFIFQLLLKDGGVEIRPLLTDIFNQESTESDMPETAFIEVDENSAISVVDSNSYDTDPQGKKPNLELVEAMLNIRNGIEFIPVFSYFVKNIVYPISKDIIPEKLAKINLPEIHSALLYAGHVGASYIGALALNIASPFESALTASFSYSSRLVFKEVLHNIASFDLSNNINMVGYCMANTALHFTPELMQLYYFMNIDQFNYGGKIIGSLLKANTLTVIQRFTTSSLECYNTYKQVHHIEENIETKIEKIITYMADAIVAVTSLVVSYNPFFVIGNIVTIDISSKIILKAIPIEIKASIDLGLTCLGMANDTSSTFANIYDIYWQGIENKHVIKTYQSCKAIADSFIQFKWLNKMYDFTSDSSYYLDKIIKSIEVKKDQEVTANQSILSQEFGEHKAEYMFKYINKPGLDIKYELLKQVALGVLTEFEYQEKLQKVSFAIDIGNTHYDLCISLNDTNEDNNRISYNCYSKENDIIDHIITDGAKLIGLYNLYSE